MTALIFFFESGEFGIIEILISYSFGRIWVRKKCVWLLRTAGARLARARHNFVLLYKSRHAVRLLRHLRNPKDKITRASMAGAVHRDSLLVEMLFYHVWLKIIQETGKRKAKVQKLTKKFSVEDDDFFDIGTSVVEEQCAKLLE